MLGAHVLLDKAPRQRLALAVGGVPAPPRGVADERVEEHRLQLGVRDGGGRALLREERRRHPDVGEVRGVPRLVHQRGEPRQPGADRGRVGERGEVSDGRLPCAVGLHPRGLRPVAEAVGVLALPVEKVEVHARARVRDAQRGERAPPLLDRLLEGEVRVELLGDVARHRERRVPWQEAGGALVGGERLTRSEHKRARPFL
mmetsp:Transcript_5310/g.13555  ORF Transcript_5310/g.13555 Transcript_5310/m.13555 type:complete len:201 (+) Transcript_5310:1925-2527(+)